MLLAAIVGTAKLNPYDFIKLLQVIWRFYLRLTDLQISWSDVKRVKLYLDIENGPINDCQVSISNELTRVTIPLE